MKKEISLEERKQIQLEMLEEFQDFCNQKGIRFSLAYGTLIGAIRHKGYIPWDDDVDIMIPLPDLSRLKKEFVSNNIIYCDVDTVKHYDFGFPRLAYKNTYNKVGITFKSYGVNIDVYPVYNVADASDERDNYFEKGKTILDRRLNFIKWRNFVVSHFPISTIPGFDKSIRNYRDYMLGNAKPYGMTNHFFVFGGKLTKKERDLCTYNFDLFESITQVDFERLKLNVIGRYHDFLTFYYGDYMQFPPESERHPYHGGHYYWD
jgi:lipopolysaccharide cholinephosphotransferase